MHQPVDCLRCRDAAIQLLCTEDIHAEWICLIFHVQQVRAGHAVRRQLAQTVRDQVTVWVDDDDGVPGLGIVGDQVLQEAAFTYPLDADYIGACITVNSRYS